MNKKGWSFLVLAVLVGGGCYRKELALAPNNGMPCGTVNSPWLKFTLEDADGQDLLTDTRLPRFYSYEGTEKKYVDYQWRIESFSSDSTQKYMVAKSIWAIENITKTFCFKDSLGTEYKVDVVIGNNPADPVCPGAFDITKLTFNNQLLQPVLKDYVVYYQFRLVK